MECTTRMEEKVNKLEVKLMEADSKADSDKDHITKLNDRIDYLMETLKKSEMENHNLKDSLQRTTSTLNESENDNSNLKESL